MSEHDTTTNTVDVVDVGLRTVVGAVDLINDAIENGLVAGDPLVVGDHGLAFRKPDGAVEVLDVRRWEDEPRLPSYITEKAKLVSVDSLARYIDRYRNALTTVANISDPYGKGLSMLTSDTDVAWVTIDDHPLLGENAPPALVGRQAHTATLVLRPTEPAKRWGNALAAQQALSQEQFLDLIVDGISEIAEPDGAVLRDLVGDLHAIRTSEVQSVVRTGGEGSIELKENVRLHAGTVGNKVTFPEQMTVTFTPFVGLAEQVVLTVRIKPTVGDTKVRFALTCAHLDDAIARVIGELAAHIVEHTGLNPLWRP